MKFLKQLLFLLVLTSRIICASMISDDHEQNLISIMKVIGKSVENELIFIKAFHKKRGKVANINLDQADQFFQQKLPLIVDKVSNVIKHDLTKKQQIIIIDLLRNLQILSTFTIDDLLKIAEGCSTYAKRENINKALKKYAPEFARKIENSRGKDLTQEEQILLTKELEKVDFHDEVLNLSKKFMCYCAYVIDIHWMTAVVDLGDLGDDDSLVLPLQLCNYLGEAIATPFVVFNDFYFFPGWEKEFEKVANMFYVVNKISSALLEVIEQQ